MTASKAREQRQRGQDIREILACELRKHSRFAQLLADQPDFPAPHNGLSQLRTREGLRAELAHGG